MSAFRYCEECDTGMDKPTPLQDLIEGQACPACGHLHFNFFSRDEWIVDLFDELAELRSDVKP